MIIEMRKALAHTIMEQLPIAVFLQVQPAFTGVAAAGIPGALFAEVECSSDRGKPRVVG